MRAMTREEQLEHVWSSTHEIIAAMPATGPRTVLFYGGRQGSVLKLLDRLAGAEVAVKLPVHLRYLPDAIAA